MNHLCNSHCEFCGCNLVEEYTEHVGMREEFEYTIFSLLLVSTNHQFPIVLDYDFQRDFSCSVCMTCAGRLLASDNTSYTWRKCHCCGMDTKREDSSAFRMVEVVPADIEEHLYKREPYEFLNPDLKTLPPKHKKFRANRSMRDVEPSVNLWLKTLDGVDLESGEDTP